jgi:hypothetical protein
MQDQDDEPIGIEPHDAEAEWDREVEQQDTEAYRTFLARKVELEAEWRAGKLSHDDYRRFVADAWQEYRMATEELLENFAEEGRPSGQEPEGQGGMGGK